MSFEYKMRMVCDRCGKVIEPWTPAGSLDKLKWDVKHRWTSKHEKTGVMLGLPNRYGKYSIYCQPCADGAKV
jgi:hypothetical protein